jgi:CheY-like chemotaxis protein
MPQDTAPKVLVVDDDAVAAALLEQLLRMAGFEAVTARTGEAALALMIEQRDGIAWLVAKAELPALSAGGSSPTSSRAGIRRVPPWCSRPSPPCRRSRC